MTFDFRLRRRIEDVDTSGRLVHQDRFQLPRYDLALQDYVAGTYYYHIQSAADQGDFVSGKFVKI